MKDKRIEELKAIAEKVQRTFESRNYRPALERDMTEYHLNTIAYNAALKAIADFMYEYEKPKPN